MTIQEFIEKSIDGGCDFAKSYIDSNGKIHDKVNITALFLDVDLWEAVGKVEGWIKDSGMCHCGHMGVDHRKYGGSGLHKDNELDCLHCECKMYRQIKNKDWKDKMNGLMPHLQEGGTIKTYLTTL